MGFPALRSLTLTLELSNCVRVAGMTREITGKFRFVLQWLHEYDRICFGKGG